MSRKLYRFRGRENRVKVLSCFDGMSCGQIAFERAGIKVDKYAIKVTMNNYPDIIQNRR